MFRHIGSTYQCDCGNAAWFGMVWLNTSAAPFMIWRRYIRSGLFSPIHKSMPDCVVFYSVPSCSVSFSSWVGSSWKVECFVVSCYALHCIAKLYYFRWSSHLPSKTRFSFQKAVLFCNVLFCQFSLNTVIECDKLYTWSFIGSGWDCSVLSRIAKSCNVLKSWFLCFGNPNRNQWRLQWFTVVFVVLCDVALRSAL